VLPGSIPLSGVSGAFHMILENWGERLIRQRFRTLNRDFGLLEKILKKLEKTIETCLNFRKKDADKKLLVWGEFDW
jgi:hypothetical protein